MDHPACRPDILGQNGLVDRHRGSAGHGETPLLVAIHRHQFSSNNNPLCLLVPLPSYRPLLVTNGKTHPPHIGSASLPARYPVPAQDVGSAGCQRMIYDAGPLAPTKASRVHWHHKGVTSGPATRYTGCWCVYLSNVPRPLTGSARSFVMR